MDCNGKYVLMGCSRCFESTEAGVEARETICNIDTRGLTKFINCFNFWHSFLKKYLSSSLSPPVYHGERWIIPLIHCCESQHMDSLMCSEPRFIQSDFLLWMIDKEEKEHCSDKSSSAFCYITGLIEDYVWFEKIWKKI